MNKGVGIVVAIAIVIAAIGGAYAFFGSQGVETSPPSGELGVSDKAEVSVTSPGEVEKAVPAGEKSELGIKDVAEVQVEDPEEETGPQNVTATGEERMSFGDNP